MKEINKIVRDERTYIESIGRADKDTVREALNDGGENTVLRLCIGASERQMPLRSLGYAESAMAIQRHYFPNAQLQVVYPLRAAEKANGLILQRSMPHAEDFDFHASMLGTADNNKVALVDTQTADNEFADAVREVLDADPILGKQLRATADKRRGNFASYVASHLLVHDTDQALITAPESFSTNRNEPSVKPERIISIGAQSERIFYAARMACRNAGVLPDGATIQTGQLFTRHVIPPYQYCREGEPPIEDLLNSRQPHDFETVHAVPSVQRDLEFLSKAIYAQSAEATMTPEQLESSSSIPYCSVSEGARYE